MNLNEANFRQANFSFINMYKILWGNKLENEALLKKRKLRTFYSFMSFFFSKRDLSRYCKEP